MAGSKKLSKRNYSRAKKEGVVFKTPVKVFTNPKLNSKVIPMAKGQGNIRHDVTYV